MEKQILANRSRLHWVDAAKGILILLMAAGHMTQRGDELGIACPAIDAIKQTGLIWAPIFMATFFILSGFWERNTYKGFKDVVVKNAKSLLLPLVVFSWLGGILHELFYEILKRTYNENALVYPSLTISIMYWFVLAMFIAKCLSWLVNRLAEKEWLRWILFVSLYLVGVLSLSAWFLPNYARWKYALVLVIYLPVGQWIFGRLGDWRWFVGALALYVGVWLLLWFTGKVFPYTTEGMMNLDLVRAVPSFVLCTAGSFVFLKLCTYIKRARVLEFIGRHTLAIYVMHWWIEILAMKVMRGFFAQGAWISTAATLVTLAVAVFIPSLISELLNQPKLRWIVGKK